MNIEIFKKAGLILLGLIFGLTVKGQQISHQVVNQTTGEHNYAVQGLVPSQPGAFFSYLWWFGDNGFRFVASPNYIHNYINRPDSCDMMLVSTENYGTSGPPPVSYRVPTYSTNGNPVAVLQPDSSLYLQNYRNAVPNDTMYLILTYKNITNPNPENGIIRLDLDPGLVLLEDFKDSFPQVYPNNEQLAQGQATWTYNNLKFGRERSILIPVFVLPTASGELNIQAHFESGSLPKGEEVNGINTFTITTPVEISHDPNMMSEYSDEIGLCAIEDDTITYSVKFQNTGKAPTRYVKVQCTLDDKLDLTRVSDIKFPRILQNHQIRNANLIGYDPADNGKWCIWYLDQTNRTLTFEMNMMVLRSLNDPTVGDLATTRAEVSFKVCVKSNYVFGPEAKAYAKIIFDANTPIATDTVFSSCIDPISITNGGGFQTPDPTAITGYPWWWYVVGGAVSLLLVTVIYRRVRRKR